MQMGPLGGWGGGTELLWKGPRTGWGPAREGLQESVNEKPPARARGQRPNPPQGSQASVRQAALRPGPPGILGALRPWEPCHPLIPHEPLPSATTTPREGPDAGSSCHPPKPTSPCCRSRKVSSALRSVRGRRAGTEGHAAGASRRRSLWRHSGGGSCHTSCPSAHTLTGHCGGSAE